MKFDVLTAVVGASTFVFTPYERGATGAFVYRQEGVPLFAPRLVATAATNDDASDNYQVQVNTPLIIDPDVGSNLPVSSPGSDLVKTQLRFLATTGSEARKLQIDKHIAILLQYRNAIANREKLYA